MLVLTRKEAQKVMLPGLGVSIKVLRCKGTAVTLGFDAPPEIRIVRDELEPSITIDDSELRERLEEKVAELPQAQRHDFRNQLNVVFMVLQTLMDDIQHGQVDTDEDLISQISHRLERISPTPNDKDSCVLVVEDHANERELLASVLRMNGYHVATATDGVEALNFLKRNNKPSFVLVDMNLPRCDGVELVRNIRQSEGMDAVQVYVVSGTNREDFDLGPNDIDAWYGKPLKASRLLSDMSSHRGNN